MSERKTPFIPAWLDDLGLTQAEFRIYCHLLRRADNETGIAWPSLDGIGETCGSSRSTVHRTLRSLVSKKLIANAGKPFGKSVRYRVFPIVSPEERLEANSVTGGTIEGPPIVSPEDSNSVTRGTPIVSPETREGSPRKVLQRRSSTIEASENGIEFANWFKSTLPENVNLPKNWQTKFAKSFDDIIRLDKRTAEEIRKVSAWARNDNFWNGNIMSPAKLRKRNGDGIQYFDVIVAKMNQPSNGSNYSNQPTQKADCGKRGQYELL